MLSQEKGRGQVRLGVFVSILQVCEYLWGKIFGSSGSDLGNVVELKSRSEVNQLDRFDIIFIRRELNQYVVWLNIRVHDTKS